MELSRLSDMLTPIGLRLRGGFHPDPADGVPSLADGRPAGTVFLVGNVGSELWRAFTANPEGADGPDPLDGWTRRVVAEVASAWGAAPLFPFEGPPYLPFQRWAMRADSVSPSPLGILIHPEYGLWHAYRAALVFPGRLALPPADRRASPCERCADRPCLRTCPVGAFADDGYRVEACRDHVRRPAGADCMAEGCRARRACPVGAAYRYAPEQAAFHMRAFRDACPRSAVTGDGACARR